MYINGKKLTLGLLLVLAVFYAGNIFLINKVSNNLIDKPVKLSFMVLEPPEDKCDGNCFNADKIGEVVKASHNIEYKTITLAYSNTLAKEYIKKYNIKTLPAIVISGDIKNEKIQSAWKALTGEERNNSIVMENLLPYFDIEQNTTKGILEAILIKDSSCTDCFNEEQYLKDLKKFGLIIGKSTIYDFNSDKGLELVKKYKIKKLPTFLLSPNTTDYSGFKDSWTTVGTIENDGWYIFRSVEKLNLKYKEL